MKHMGLIVAALAVTLAASVPVQAGLSHIHYCDCGHPQGKVACGELMTTETTHREKAPVDHKTRRLVTVQNAPGSEQGVTDMVAAEIPDEVRSSVKLGVLAVLLPCLLALGVMGVGLISRRK